MLAAAIKTAIKARHRKFSEVAATISVKKPTLSNWCRGGRAIPADALHEIENTLKVRVTGVSRSRRSAGHLGRYCAATHRKPLVVTCRVTGATLFSSDWACDA